MSRDAFTYGCLTQHSLPLELLQWIWQDWNPAPLLCAGTHPIALSAAVVLMQRLIKLLFFHVLVTLGWLVRCLYFFSQSAKMQFGLACFATWHWAKHRSFGCFQSNKDTFCEAYPLQHFRFCHWKPWGGFYLKVPKAMENMALGLAVARLICWRLWMMMLMVRSIWFRP